MKLLHFNRFFKILTGIILFFVVVLFAAPRVARLYVNKHGKELTGRVINIGKIRINYFTGRLSADNMKFYEEDGKSVFASFKKLRINIDYLPLLKREIAVKYITLDEPYIQVLQNGSRFNFSDLIKSDTTKPAKDTIPSQPLKYIINNIKISKGYVRYTDEELRHTIALDSLDLAIPGFTWNSESAKLDVNFNFVDGGGLYSKLDINQADSTYAVNLKLDSLNLGIIEPYIKNYLNISSLNGYLSNDILIKGSMNSVMKLFIRGINNVYGFSLRDLSDRTILSADNFTVDIDTFRLDRNRIRLNSVDIKNPFVLVELTDSTNNWMKLVKETAAEQPDTINRADTSGAETSFSYNFPKITISGGNILFTDKTLRYPFEYKLENVALQCNEIQGTPEKLGFKISASLDGNGTVGSEGIINPENFNDMDLTLDIEQFRMKDAESYFKHYFGFPVTGGVMNFKTDNKIRPGSLVSDNSLYFRRFTLGNRLKEKSEYKIPLRLALGILSDKDGIIDLKAPVRMKGEEVKIINLGRIIFRIIGNLFVKAAVSPVNMLSDLFKADPASLKEIRLDLENAAPDEKNMKSVDIISDVLNKKPMLNVDFIYCINRQKAADSIAYMIALKNYLDENKNTAAIRKNVPDSVLINYLLSKPSLASFKDNPNLSALCTDFAGQAKIDTRLDSLKRIQTGFLSGYLTGEKGFQQERFRIIENTPDSIMPAVKYPSFRIYFTSGEKQD